MKTLGQPNEYTASLPQSDANGNEDISNMAVDDASVRKLIQRALPQHGCTVETASDGIAAHGPGCRMAGTIF